MKTLTEWEDEGYALNRATLKKIPAIIEIIDGKEVKFFSKENVRENIPNKIYQYDIQNKKKTDRSPWASNISNEDALFEQYRLAQQYEDCSIELEIFYRKKYRFLRKKANPQIEVIEKEIKLKKQEKEIIYNCIRDRNIEGRKKTSTPQEKSQVKKLNSEIKLLSEQIKVCKPPKEELQKLSQDKKNSFKELRNKFIAKGLFWGTASAKEVDIQNCLNKKGSDPEFLKHWDGNGKIAVQFQKSKKNVYLTIEKALSCKDDRLQIRLAPQSRTRKKKIKTGLDVAGNVIFHTEIRYIDYVVRLRIEEKEKNSYTEFNINYDRDIPENSIIRWVYLNRERIDGKYVYKCNFVISCKNGFSKLDSASKGTVGVDPGSREINKIDGKYDLLYATCNFNDGTNYQCVLPWDVVNKQNYIAGLQKIRDDELNSFKEKIKNLKLLCPHLSESLQKILLLKSPRKIKDFCLGFLESVKEVDIISCIKGWLKKETHIKGIQCNLRNKLGLRKTHLMKNEAAKIRRKAKYMAIGDDEMPKMNQSSNVLKNDNKAATQKKNKNFARCSPGDFRRLFIENGGIEVDCKNTTKECPQCHKKRDIKSDKILICEHCGTVSDRDEDGAINTRAKGELFFSEQLGCKIEDLY